MSRVKAGRFLNIRSLGNLLILFAILGIGATFGPSLYYEIQFRLMQARGVRYAVVEQNPQGNTSSLGEIIKQQKRNEESSQIPGLATILASPKEEILIPKDTEFSILILKIGLNAKVFSNVDSLNEEEFLPILEKGVAHAKGSVFPGMEGSIYLFAHSTDDFWNVGRYNAFFYLLKELSVGDEIIIFFKNRRYSYIMSESRIVDPSSASLLLKGQEEKKEVLILQTCWPPGTTWKRLLIFAKRK